MDRFFKFLDRRVGLANVVIVITGDHGVAPFPEVMRQHDPRADATRLNPSVSGRRADRVGALPPGRCDAVMAGDDDRNIGQTHPAIEELEELVQQPIVRTVTSITSWLSGP